MLDTWIDGVECGVLRYADVTVHLTFLCVQVLHRRDADRSQTNLSHEVEKTDGVRPEAE